MEVEDAFPEDEFVEYAPPPETVRSSPQKSMFEADRSEEDWVLEIYCFYNNLNDIGLYLQGLWTEFKDGKIDLMVSSSYQSSRKPLLILVQTASIVTDTASDLFDQVED